VTTPVVDNNEAPLKAGVSRQVTDLRKYDNNYRHRAPLRLRLISDIGVWICQGLNLLNGGNEGDVARYNNI